MSGVRESWGLIRESGRLEMNAEDGQSLYRPVDLAEAVRATEGPFFFAYWKRKDGHWDSEQYRLFRNAKDRCQEEIDHGAELAYVKHAITDEAVFSLARAD